jgi:hypothetical protein
MATGISAAERARTRTGTLSLTATEVSFRQRGGITFDAKTKGTSTMMAAMAVGSSLSLRGAKPRTTTP